MVQVLHSHIELCVTEILYVVFTISWIFSHVPPANYSLVLLYHLLYYMFYVILPIRFIVHKDTWIFGTFLLWYIFIIVFQVIVVICMARWKELTHCFVFTELVSKLLDSLLNWSEDNAMEMVCSKMSCCFIQFFLQTFKLLCHK